MSNTPNTPSTRNVRLTLQLLSIENATEDTAAIEAALDRIPGTVVSALHAAGFTLTFPISYEILGNDDIGFTGEVALFDQDVDA